MRFSFSPRVTNDGNENCETNSLIKILMRMHKVIGQMGAIAKVIFVHNPNLAIKLAHRVRILKYLM